MYAFTDSLSDASERCRSAAGAGQMCAQVTVNSPKK